MTIFVKMDDYGLIQFTSARESHLVTYEVDTGIEVFCLIGVNSDIQAVLVTKRAFARLFPLVRFAFKDVRRVK